MIKHHRGKFGWYFTFEEEYCNNCKKVVPTVVIKWLWDWKRCAFCLMKPDVKIPFPKKRDYMKYIKKAEVPKRSDDIAELDEDSCPNCYYKYDKYDIALGLCGKCGRKIIFPIKQDSEQQIRNSENAFTKMMIAGVERNEM